MKERKLTHSEKALLDKLEYFEKLNVPSPKIGWFAQYLNMTGVGFYKLTKRLKADGYLEPQMELKLTKKKWK